MAKRTRRKASTKKTARKTSTGKKTGKKAGRKAAPRGIEATVTAELAAELRRRQRDLDKLQRRRERLADQISVLDAEIAQLGGGLSGVGGVRRRPRNDSNLADALVQSLSGKEMGVTQVAEAVQAAGYRTSSPNFRTIVNQTLIKDKRIKRVARGLYTAK